MGAVETRIVHGTDTYRIADLIALAGAPRNRLICPKSC